MLDKNFIINNPDAVAENMRHRRMDGDIEGFLQLEGERRSISAQLQELQGQANRIARSGSAKSADARTAAQAMRTQIQALSRQANALEKKTTELWRAFPNMTHEAAPVGPDDTFNKEIAVGKTPIREFDFTPKDHIALGEDMGILDFEAGSKVAGAGFYFLKGDAARMELALQNYVLNKLADEGFIPVVTPDVAKQEILSGTGYNPRGEESNTYKVEGDDLCLIATSEITLCGQYADTVIDKAELPVMLAGVSHCFRTERGSGKASKGLYRVHQFSKVEMVVLAEPEKSEEMHLRLLEIEKSIFDDLEIPYRVVENATGDLGAAAYRKFDIEAWMPGRGEGGSYGEVTSTSNCTDYQSRRLNIKYADKKKGSPRELVHTLNGTGLAIGRAMIALMENHQQPDGTVLVPKALQGYFGKERMTGLKGPKAPRSVPGQKLEDPKASI